MPDGKCPKCKAEPTAPLPGSKQWQCGRIEVGTQGFIGVECERRQSQATITHLQQQLADARLLARACRNYFWYDEAKKSIAIYVGCKTIEDHPCELDPDGLPILTDELRDALKGAVGE